MGQFFSGQAVSPMLEFLLGTWSSWQLVRNDLPHLRKFLCLIALLSSGWFFGRHHHLHRAWDKGNSQLHLQFHFSLICLQDGSLVVSITSTAPEKEEILNFTYNGDILKQITLQKVDALKGKNKVRKRKRKKIILDIIFLSIQYPRLTSSWYDVDENWGDRGGIPN